MATLWTIPGASICGLLLYTFRLGLQGPLYRLLRPWIDLYLNVHNGILLLLNEDMQLCVWC